MKVPYPIHRLAFHCGCAIFLAAQLSTPGATLSNRWSFGESNGSLSVTDSISGVIGTLQGTAYLDGTGNVVLDGNPGTYVDLTGGLLTNTPDAVTLEAWVNNSSIPDNVCLFSFDDGAGTGQSAAGGYLRYVIHDQSNARSQFELATTGADSQLVAFPGLGDQTVHVVCVYDTVRGFQAIYTNGVVQAAFVGTLRPLNLVGTNSSSLGRSPWWSFGDPYLAASINEFRIWNGALNPLEIAGSDLAGADTVGTAYGTVTNIQLQVSFQMVQNTFQQAAVVASASALTYPVDIALLATYSSANTNVVTVNSNGIITATGLGSAGITAVYAGMTNSQTITVVPGIATLIHRYGFTNDVTDSVGGAAFDGTLQNGATITGGAAVLDSSLSQFVSLPQGIVSNRTVLTFEAWLTNSATPDNVCLFEFGDEAGTGANYLRFVIHDQSNGRSQFEMNAGGNSNIRSFPGLGNQTVHVVCIYDPAAQVQAVFTNGMLAAKRTGSAIPALSNLSPNGGSLGRSPWYAFGDPYLTGAIDEFRIYSGELTPQKIAMNYKAGADNYTTNNEGALLSITLQVPATMVSQTVGVWGLLANYAALTNFNFVLNSIFPLGGLSVSSSDSSVVTVATTGQITAGNPGTAVVTAVYQGVTNHATVTVVRPAPATLLHRYSFNEANGTTTAADSIGAADGTLLNTAQFDGAGHVVLDGTTGTYVSLPGGLLSGLTAVTFEAWLTNSVTPDNVCLFSFDNGLGTGGNYIRYVIHDQSNARSQLELTGGGQLLAFPGQGSATTVHIVCVYDQADGVEAIYTNGVMQAIRYGVTASLANVPIDAAAIGQSPWWSFGDAYLAASIDEFRIYSGRLIPEDVARNQALGPNYLSVPSLQVSVAAGNITLSWPTNFASPDFGLWSSSALGTGAAWSAVGTTPTVAGTNYQVSVPIANGSQFFRLRK